MVKGKISRLLIRFDQSRELKHVPLFHGTGLLQGNILTGKSMSHGLELSLQQSLHPLSQSKGLLT
jgi:hypothetical protein